MKRFVLKRAYDYYRRQAVKPITLVSTPRSGNHWLTRMTIEYCSRLANVEPQIEYKIAPTDKGDQERFVRVGELFSYCEYYEHCRSVPCRSGAKFQKNHDFEFDLSIDRNLRYVVMTRNPLYGILAYYDYVDREASWEAFAKRESEYWCRFVDKWIIRRPRESLIIQYETLIADPVPTVSTFLTFCGIPVREDLLQFKDSPRKGRDLDPSLDYSIVKKLTSDKYRQVLDLMDAQSRIPPTKLASD